MKIYLDNNRITPVDEQVLSAMMPLLEEPTGDLNAYHDPGAQSRKRALEALEKIQAALNANSADTIVLTSGAAESNNTVFKNAYLHWILTGRKNNIVISEREPPSILQAARFLEEQGCRVNRLPVNGDGIVDPESLYDYLTPRTALVSIQMVDAESGAINPVEEIAQICRQYEVPFHTDATQALGKIPVDLQRLEADYLSFSGETIHAPTGIGGLYLRAESELIPLVHGSRGPWEEFRGGALNLAGLVGMGKAVELASDALGFEMEEVREHRDALEEGLKAIEGVSPLIPWALRVPNTLVCTFEGVESELLLYELNRAGISAYSYTLHPYGEWKRTPLVEALGMDPALSHTTVGFALSRENSGEEMQRVLATVEESLNYLRAFSAAYPSKERS